MIDDDNDDDDDGFKSNHSYGSLFVCFFILKQATLKDYIYFSLYKRVGAKI